MRKRTLHIIISILLYAINISADNAGLWRYYPAYNGISEVDSISPKCIFVLSSGNLFSINKQEGSVQTYDRITGLTDTGIKTMAWNSAAKVLMLIYDNSNIDLLNTNGDVTNIPDLYIKETTLNKAVNHIFIKNNDAYLSTGFGILKVDMKKAEVSDSYNLRSSIIKCYADNNNIYALRDDNSVIFAALSDNLLDYNTWQPYTGSRDGMFEDEKIKDSTRKWVDTYIPSGPKYSFIGNINLKNGNLYIAENIDWNDSKYDCPAIYNINDDKWTNLINDKDYIKKITGIQYDNFANTVVDPLNPHHVMVGGTGGIYEFIDNKFVKLWNELNSPLKTTIAGNLYFTLTTALCYTTDGTLWVAVTLAQDETTFLSLSKDGKWTKHHSNKWIYDNIPFAHVKNMFEGSNNYIWWINHDWRRPSLCGYNIVNEKKYCYYKFINQDNTVLNATTVNCATEDMNGNIWIGTNVGTIMLEKEFVGMNEDNVTWQQIKVPRNDGTNYADYLLAGVDINFIAIDGGNRKWFATNGNGLYLIDSDNITQLKHFTKSNSPLPSDYIYSLCIDNKTGIVYIGTDKGLCSYHSDATQAYDNLSEDNIYAYPNPVTPDYTGPITITGLTFNADVKITTTSGQLIAQGRSNGGSFVWNGLDRNGKRVASGIYMVCVSTEDGKEGIATKIAIVR